MHRLLFLGWFLFLLTTAVAQEKVTDFENFATQSPNNFKYIGKLQDKIIFTAFTPETGIELWVSGGRPENTKMLKDINLGEISTYMHNFTFQGTWLYFTIDNKIWKTDGTEENTIKIFESDKGGSLLELSTIEDKILVIMSTYLLDKNTEFFWLKKDKLEKWEENIVTYNVIPNSLVFTKQTTSSQTYTYYHFRIRKQEIYISENLDWQTITQFSHGNENYISFNDLKRVLIHFKTEDDFEVLDWGNHKSSVPFYSIDEEDNFYLMKLSTYEEDKDSVSIYKSVNGDIRLEKRFLSKRVNPMGNYSGTSDFYSNVIFKNNKIIFINGYMSMSTRMFYYNEYDLLTNTHTQKRINFYHIDNIGNVLLTQLSDSTYKITATDFSIVYHPESNTVSNKTDRANEAILIKNTENPFEFSDNLYLLKDSLKLPLLNIRKVFKNNWSDISRQTYKDKEYLILSDGTKRYYEIWEFDNVLQKKIFSGRGFAGNFVQLNGIPDKMYYTVSDTTRLHLYEIDMAAKDFKFLKSFSMQALSYTNHAIIGSDESNFICIFKDKIIEIPREENEFLFSILPDFVYSSKFCGSDACIYQLTKNGKKYIYKGNVNSTNAWSYENIMYLRDSRRIVSIDENQRNRVLVDSMEYVIFLKKYLVTISKKANSFTYSTIDLSLNKIITTIDIKSKDPYSIHAYKNWVFYSKRFSELTDEVIYYNQKEYIKIPLPKMGMYAEPTFYKDGFFISSFNQNTPSVYTLLYYDINTKIWTTIMNDTQEGQPSFMINDMSDFAIIRQYTTEEGTKYHLWNYTTKQLKQFPLYNFAELRGNYVINYESGDNKILYLPDLLPVDKVLPAKETKDVDQTDIVAITTHFNTETGRELMVLGPNYFVNMPEIVKGKEGMILKDYFYINNTLYIYAFTYTHGWQVWKMGEFNPDRILATENSSEVGLVVYPNPVQDFLHINTEKPLNYKLVNIIGQEVKRGKVSARELIDVKNIPTGIYIIQLFDGTANFARKIIKY